MDTKKKLILDCYEQVKDIASSLGVLYEETPLSENEKLKRKSYKKGLLSCFRLTKDILEKITN